MEKIEQQENVFPQPFETKKDFKDFEEFTQPIINMNLIKTATETKEEKENTVSNTVKFN